MRSRMTCSANRSNVHPLRIRGAVHFLRSIARRVTLDVRLHVDARVPGFTERTQVFRHWPYAVSDGGADETVDIDPRRRRLHRLCGAHLRDRETFVRADRVADRSSGSERKEHYRTFG